MNNITSQRWLDIFDLQSCVQEFGGFSLDEICIERVSAMQAATTYPKLMLLGKPGSGKTTFLQYIATQCNQGNFLPDSIPLFIRLKNFALYARETGDFDLFNYITQELTAIGTSKEQIQTLLAEGRVLILLDGLDEIPEDDRPEIVKKIRKFSEEYYKNKFIITCRIGTAEYQFDSFTDIEIADFDFCQIEAYVQNWFVNVGRNSTLKGKDLACEFMQKLQLSENRQIRELASTPLLLNMVCCAFQARSDFPDKGIELYKQALVILLNRWDEVRSIKRDKISHLSLPDKLKLLSHIATISFNQELYFFTKSNLRQYIADYLRNLPTVQVEKELVQLNSEAVLKLLKAHGILIEQARGIYSFSHLAFQEYLTARNIAKTSADALDNLNIDIAILI